MDGNINSHIQITKSILKNYSFHKLTINNGYPNKEKFVYYYDFKTNNIKEDSIKELGTELGYYGEFVENFLNVAVEDKLGQLNKKIKDLNKGKSIDLKKTDLDAAFNYIIFSFIRSKFLLDTINSLINYDSIESPKNSLQDALVFSFDAFLNIIVDVFEMEKRLMKFTKIKSKRSFVIPRNCFYTAYTKTFGDCLVFPITPETAIILIKEEHGNGNVLEILTDDIVEEFNNAAYYFERLMNKEFIVGSKDELEKYCDENYSEKLLMDYVELGGKLSDLISNNGGDSNEI